MPSQQLNNVVGALGGAVLAGCLVPQLWKLYWTRSAQDLSYLFLMLYNLGLLLSFIYLFHEDATVGWICMLVELGFASTMVAAKGYLDYFGPRGALRSGKARGGEGSTKGGLKGVQLDMEAPLPLLCPAPGHAAQHLLLDARLSLPGDEVESAAPEGSVRSGGGSVRGGTHFLGMREGSGQGRVGGAAAASQRAVAAAAALGAATDMLEQALREGGASVQLRHLQSLPALRRGTGAVPEGADVEAAAPDMVFLACSDGYATAVLHPGAAALSVDFLAASAAAAPRMGAAAAAFCARLQAAYPGTRVTASTVARLPTQ